MSSSTTITVTPQEIINHRKWRKASGMAGCITGRPVPEINFFGYSDVQSWRPSDPKNPHCFCFDCRELWDSDAKIDTELVNSGHRWACDTYASLLAPPTSPTPTPQRTMSPPPAPRKVTPADVLAERDVIRATGRLAHSANSSGWVNSSPSCSCTTCRDIYDPTGEAEAAAANEGAGFSNLPPPPLTLTRQSGLTSAPSSPPFSARSPSLTPPALAARSNGGGIDEITGINTEQPTYSSFSQIPMSLPAPRRRDIANETHAERLKNELGVLRGEINTQLVITMDRRRDAICYEGNQRTEYLAKLDEQEVALWAKIDAINVLLKN